MGSHRDPAVQAGIYELAPLQWGRLPELVTASGTMQPRKVYLLPLGRSLHGNPRFFLRAASALATSAALRVLKILPFSSQPRRATSTPKRYSAMSSVE